jgi:hypothetical protein
MLSYIFNNADWIVANSQNIVAASFIIGLAIFMIKKLSR